MCSEMPSTDLPDSTEDDSKGSDKFTPAILEFDSAVPNTLNYFVKDHGFKPQIENKDDILLLQVKEIQHVSKKIFKIGGSFYNDNKTINSYANAKDIDSFLLIGPLSNVCDISDDIDNEAAKLLSNFGNIKIENSDYLKYKQNELVLYKPMQKYHRKKPISMESSLMKIIEVLPHAYVGDLSIEYKVASPNGSSNTYYSCHESLLRPQSFEENKSDSFETDYHAMVLYELERALKLKKYDLFEHCLMKQLPLLYDIDSSFFNKKNDFNWFMNNAPSLYSLGLLNDLFDLEMQKILNNILKDLDSIAHNIDTSMHISKLNQKLKYGTKINAMSMHSKIGYLFNNNVGNMMTRTHASIWIVISNESQLRHLKLSSNDLIFHKDSDTTLKLLLNDDNKLQFKWNRGSEVFFLEKFTYKTLCNIGDN